MKKSTETDLQRWESRVQRPNGWHGCWYWTGAANALGKGNFAPNEGPQQTMSAHRWGWIHWRGEIPPNRVVTRECETFRCVSPWHHKLYTKSAASAKARNGKRFDPNAEVSVPVEVLGNGMYPPITCQHHFLIESPNGPTSDGVCKKCKEKRTFHNSLHVDGWSSDKFTSKRPRGRPRKVKQHEGVDNG